MKNSLHEEKAYLVPEESQTEVRLSFDWISEWTELFPRSVRDRRTWRRNL